MSSLYFDALVATLMLLICHNTDLAKGWDRIGVDDRYTAEVSKPKALPMGINILFYALTNSPRG